MQNIDAEIESLSRVISASEPWAVGYDDAPEQHAELIRYEARLETKLRRYFRELAEQRVMSYVNLWMYEAERTKVTAHDSIKAYDVAVMVDETLEGTEASILLNLIIDDVTYMIAIGAQAGEWIYSTPLGMNQYTAAVMTAARKQSATLVKGVSNTTRDRIMQQVGTSLKLGETTPQLTERLTKKGIINDARRAEMIARTESVDSYSRGLVEFGKASGAVGMEWQAIDGACRICRPLDGIEVEMGKSWEYEYEYKTKPSEHRTVKRPPAHPRCRCTLRMIYTYEP